MFSRSTDREYFNKHNREFRRRNRELAIAAYGGRCSCCGDDTFEFLALDHTDGYKGIGPRSGDKLIAWAKKNGFPDFLQVLCHNCHGAKSWYGGCPHVE